MWWKSSAKTHPSLKYTACSQWCGALSLISISTLSRFDAVEMQDMIFTDFGEPFVLVYIME